MVKKTVIISPHQNDRIYSKDILNHTHCMNAKAYANKKKIMDITYGYNDLAALNYVVLFVLENVIEIFSGLAINDKQVNELRRFVDDYSNNYDDLNMEFGMYDKNKKFVKIKTYVDLDDLLYENYNITKRKDGINVGKKI